MTQTKEVASNHHITWTDGSRPTKEAVLVGFDKTRRDAQGQFAYRNGHQLENQEENQRPHSKVWCAR